MCDALLTLHAIADEACAGLGIALDRSDGKGCLYRARGRELLARTGSLARIQLGNCSGIAVQTAPRMILVDTPPIFSDHYRCVAVAYYRFIGRHESAKRSCLSADGGDRRLNIICKACMGDQETGHLLLPVSGKRCPYADKPPGQTQGLVLTGSIEPSGAHARKIRREAEWLHELFRMDNGQGDWKKGMR